MRWLWQRCALQGQRRTRSDERGGIIRMTRLNLVLLLAVLASALYLVGVQYESRRLFSALDRANSEAQKLESDNERLQVEKRAQATPLRVEKLAKEQLQMRTATPAITHYVNYAAAAPEPQERAAGIAPAPELLGQGGKGSARNPP